MIVDQLEQLALAAEQEPERAALGARKDGAVVGVRGALRTCVSAGTHRDRHAEARRAGWAIQLTHMEAGVAELGVQPAQVGVGDVCGYDKGQYTPAGSIHQNLP